LCSHTHLPTPPPREQTGPTRVVVADGRRPGVAWGNAGVGACCVCGIGFETRTRVFGFGTAGLGAARGGGCGRRHGRLGNIGELSAEDLTLLLGFLDALITKNRLKALAGGVS
jgi:hypothetical protein